MQQGKHTKYDVKGGVQKQKILVSVRQPTYTLWVNRQIPRTHPHMSLSRRKKHLGESQRKEERQKERNKPTNKQTNKQTNRQTNEGREREKTDR